MILVKNDEYENTFNLEGKCSRIYKNVDTLQLTCEISRNSFVAEYYIKDVESKKPSLILNRYNNDVDDVNQIYEVGLDKQILISEDELVLMHRALPR